ncbi:MAG: UDP-N-acetylmuramoyl-L-alanine--D-glutamate ligase [Prochlorotrichaceae cyanobacterium]
MKTAHVIGLGKSGLAAARLLKFQGWTVSLHDRSDTPALQEHRQHLAAEGLTVQLGHPYDFRQFDPSPQLIVVSPGVSWDLPGLQEAREAGLEVIGEMALAWRTLRDRPWVGITGTNGKTTTTALVAAIFQAAGFHAPACGNIGYAACELALQFAQGQPVDWVIAELSSYQIESSPEVAPAIGIWTTFTPDHLARHYTLENYFSIKAQLLKNSAWPIFNGDDPALKQQIPSLFPQANWSSTQGKAQLLGQADQGTYVEAGWVCFQDQRIVPVQDLKMVGQHNAQNLLLATAAALKAGIAPSVIADAVRQFPGVPHRLEWVRTHQGVDFINDSKATNYDAAWVGLAAVEAPVILIAGGEAKAGEDGPWLQAIQEKAAIVLLIGKAGQVFAQRLAEVGYTAVEVVETLDQAVKRSFELIPQVNPKVVLLSPACASFDQYPNFEARGDHFRTLCQEGGRP